MNHKLKSENEFINVTGNVHSIESLGTLDGPGIRMIVFFQGCRLRCMYCHNPDTWSATGGSVCRPEDVVEKAKRFKPYYKLNDGGVTFSGGEPLVQPEFLLECLKKCKNENIHTVLDTSGVGFGDYDEILKHTDLVILDIKHANPEKYKKITGLNIKYYHEFKEAVIKNNKDIWLKHVVTPTVNDTREDMLELEREVESFPDRNVKKVELLPYHTLGVFKYNELNIDYRLKDVMPMTREKLDELKSYLNIKNLVR